MDDAGANQGEIVEPIRSARALKGGMGSSCAVLPTVGLILGIAGIAYGVPSRAAAEKSDIGSPCSTDFDCARHSHAPWCTPDGLCGSCSWGGPCQNAGEECIGHKCSVPCVDADDCGDATPLCDGDPAICVQCRDDADCPSVEYCTQGLCLPDQCVPGTLICLGRTIARCDTDRGATTNVDTCEETCELVDGEPTCAAAGTSTGDDVTGAGTVASSGGSETAGGSGPGGTTGSVDDGVDGGLDERGCACGAVADGTGPTVALGLLLLVARRRRLGGATSMS